MALIKFENVGIDFPIFNAASRSIKKNFINFATGGKVGSRMDVLLYLRSITLTLKSMMEKE